MSRDLGYLVDIGLAIQEALEFVEGITWEAFTTDRKTQAAVMHELTIIGEAARRVSADFRTHHDELPWPDMIGVRNRIVHEYDHIKLDILWDTLKTDLPSLLKQIEPLIENEE